MGIIQMKDKRQRSMKKVLRKVVALVLAGAVMCTSVLVTGVKAQAASETVTMATTMSCSVWSVPNTAEENRVKRIDAGYCVTVYPEVVQSTAGDGKTFYMTGKGNYILCKCFEEASKRETASTAVMVTVEESGIWSAPSTAQRNRVSSVPAGTQVTVIYPAVSSTLRDGKRFYQTTSGTYILCDCLEFPSLATTEPTPQKETEHFVFYCTVQDIGVLDKLEESFEGCYERTTTDLGKAPAGKTNVYVYPDLQSLHNAEGRPDDPDWSCGEAWNGSVYMVSPLNPGPAHDYDDMFEVAVHEYVHVIVQQINQRQESYLDEGIACYEAGQKGSPYYVRNDIAYGTLPALTDLLADEGFLYVSDAGKAYAYAYIYIDFIVKTFGFDSVIALLSGKSQTEAFGVSMEEANRKWIDFLNAYVN